MEIKLGKAFEEMLARVGHPGGTQLIAGELVVSSTAKKVVAKTARSPRAKKSTSRRRGPSQR